VNFFEHNQLFILALRPGKHPTTIEHRPLTKLAVSSTAGDANKLKVG